MVELAGKLGHDAESVVPESLNLYRLATPRSDHPVADFRVHPCELYALFTGCKQAAGINFDPITCAANMPGNDVGKNREQLFTNETQITRVCEILARSFKKPERGIHRVVLGSFAGIGKAVWQHPLICTLCECTQDAAGDVIFSSGKSQAGEGDHCVASPVAKPVIAGNDRLVRLARNDVLIGGSG